MKQQIRQGVFETNSSTQHALVIRCDDKTRTIADGIPANVKVPEKIQLRTMSYGDIDNLPLTTVENRILYLYNVMCSNNAEKEDLINFLSRIGRLGINYEIAETEDYVYYDFPCDMIEDIMKSEETFVAFIFARDVFYDTYADDCGSWEEQCEWEDTIEKFIKESKNDVIELRDRC